MHLSEVDGVKTHLSVALALARLAMAHSVALTLTLLKPDDQPPLLMHNSDAMADQEFVLRRNDVNSSWR